MSGDQERSPTPAEYGSWLVASNDSAPSAQPAHVDPISFQLPQVVFDPSTEQKLELLTISWIIKAKEYLSVSETAHAGQFPVAVWAQEQPCQAAGLCGALVGTYYQQSVMPVDAPLPQAVSQLIDVSVREVAVQAKVRGVQLVLVQVLRDGSFLGSVSTVAQRALSTTATDPGRMRAARKMLLHVLRAAQDGFCALSDVDHRLGDALVLAQTIAVCTELLECAVHVLSAGAIAPTLKQQSNKKGGKPQNRQGPRTTRGEQVEAESSAAFFVDVLKSVCAQKVPNAFNQVGQHSFRPSDASFPVELTRAALRWTSLCGGVMHALCVAAPDATVPSPLDDLVAFADSLLTQMSQSSGRPPQPWSLLLLAALGTLPNNQQRVAMQWNAVHHGAGDIGANILYFGVEVFTTTITRMTSWKSSPQTTALLTWPKLLLTFATQICRNAGGGPSMHAAVDRIVRHLGDCAKHFIDKGEVSSPKNGSRNDARRGERGGAARLRPPLRLAAELVWGLIALPLGVRGTEDNGLSALWRQVLRFPTLEVQRVATKMFMALSHERGGSPFELSTLLRSLVTKSLLPTASRPGQTQGALTAWLSSLSSADVPEDSGAPFLDAIRQTIESEMKDGGVEAPSSTQDSNQLLFETFSAILHDIVHHMPCPRSSVRRLVLSVANGLVQLHERNSACVLSDAMWSSDDITRAFEALSGYSREDKGRKDTDINLGRVISVARSHAGAMETAILFLTVCPPASMLSAERVRTLCMKATRSPCSGVRKAAVRAQKLCQQLSVHEGASHHIALPQAKKAAAQGGLGALQKFGLQLFHDVLAEFGNRGSSVALDGDEKCPPEILLSALYGVVTNNDVPSWSRAVFEAIAQVKSTDEEPWQMRTASFLSMEVLAGVTNASSRDHQSGRAADANRRAQTSGAMDATDLLELCVLWMRERRWEGDIPRERRGALRDVCIILTLMMSQLDGVLLSSGSHCDRFQGVQISPVVLHHLNCLVPGVRPYLGELSVFIAQTMSRAGGTIESTEALLAVAIRVDTARLKDIRQVAGALLTGPSDHPQHHGQHETAKRRVAVIQEIIRVCLRSAQVRILWTDASNYVLDGHLQGLAALASRLIPDLVNKGSAPSQTVDKQPRHRKGDAAAPKLQESSPTPPVVSTASHLGNHVVEILVGHVLPAAEAYHHDKYTDALRYVNEFVAALTDHSEPIRVAASLILIAEVSCFNMMIEIASNSLGRSEAVDERDVMDWFCAFKDALRGALRCFKSDGLTSKEIREGIADTGLLSKDVLSMVHQILVQRLPVDEGDAETDMHIGEDDKRRSLYLSSDDGRLWVVKRRRSDILSRLADGVMQAALRHREFGRLVGQEGQGKNLSTTAAVGVPEVCRGVLEFVFDDEEYEDEPNAAAPPPLSAVEDDACKARGWMALADDLSQFCSKAQSPHVKRFADHLRDALRTSNVAVLVKRRNALLTRPDPSAQLAAMEGTLWMAIEAKIRSGCSAVADGVVDLERELDVAVSTLCSLERWAEGTTSPSEVEEVRAALAYALVDWMRLSVVPTTRGDQTRLSGIIKRLTINVPQSAAYVPVDTSSAEEAVHEWMRWAVEHLCPAEHRHFIQRHYAAFSHHMVQRRGDPIKGSSHGARAVYLLPLYDYICSETIIPDERSHWIARLFIRLADLPPSAVNEKILSAALLSPNKWVCNITVEVACALLCKTVEHTSTIGTASFYSKFIAIAVGSPTAGFRPNACFLVNSLRFSHAAAFRVQLEHLDDSQKAALDALHRYCVALESIASTPAELAAVTTTVISEEAERFVNLFQEILTEVNAMNVDAEQKSNTTKGSSRSAPVDDLLPELGGEVTHEHSISNPVASGNTLLQETRTVITEFADWIEDNIHQLKERMSCRLKPDGGAATWFDRSMWYVERDITDMTAPLPSAHPDAKGGAFAQALATTNEFIAGTKAGLARIASDTRNAANTSRLCSQLNELIVHTCQGIRQDVCTAFRRASQELRRHVESHVVSWYHAAVPGNSGQSTRTIQELFGGVLPKVLQDPIPVSFTASGTKENLSWKLDHHFVELTKSQECPRTIRFRGTRSASAVPVGASKASRKQMHFTQTFVLKGNQPSDHVARDHLVMSLLRELQLLQHHTGRGQQHILSTEQWLAQASALDGRVYTPCFAVFPFAQGGGLAEWLHGNTAVSTLVDEWRSATRLEMQKGDDSRVALPVSLHPPLVQFHETLKSVVDEHNARQQEVRSRQRSAPPSRERSAQAPPQSREGAFVDLNRPSPELIRETYLRLLRLQPSSRECIFNAIFAEVRHDGEHAQRSVISSDLLWVQRWNTYMRSLATGSALSYILGIGDRHLGNMMICTEESFQRGRSQRKRPTFSDGIGLVAHVDFAVCFGAGAKLRFPERVPFRLSPIFMHPLGAYGSEGGFAEVLRQVLTTVHQNESFVLEVTDALRWLVPLSGPVRTAIHAQPAAVDTAAQVGRQLASASILRGSMVAAIDRVAERVFRHLENLFTSVMAPSPKSPNGQWMSTRQQVHQQFKFQSIAATGRRLLALTDEHRTLRTEQDLSADISSLSSKLSSSRTAAQQFFEEFQESLRSCQRVMQRLREVTSQVTLDGGRLLEWHQDPASTLERALSMAIALPQRIAFALPHQNQVEESLWQGPQEAAATAHHDVIQIKTPSSVSMEAWNAHRSPTSPEEVGVASLLGASWCPQQLRLLQRDQAARHLHKLMQLSEDNFQPSLLQEIQREIDELQRWVNPQAVPSQTASVLQRPLEAALQLVKEIEWPSELVNQCNAVDEDSPDDENSLVSGACAAWFGAVRRTFWTQTPDTTDAGDRFAQQVTEALLQLHFVRDNTDATPLCSSGAVAVACTAACRLHHDAACIVPTTYKPVLEQLLVSLCPLQSNADVIEKAVHQACCNEVVVLVQALFCVEYLDRRASTDVATLLREWQRRLRSVACCAMVMSALESVASQLGSLLHDPHMHSAAEQILGELAGLPTVQAASDALVRFDSMTEDIIVDIWPSVSKAASDIGLYEKQLNEVQAERSRLRQRSAVIHNEHRLLTDLLRHSLTPVTLNPLSMLVRQVQVCLENLYKELHTDLAETVLPRLLNRATGVAGSGAAPSQSTRSPMQMAAQLLQRSEHDVANVLNMTHQLITEGYEELAMQISRGATAMASRRLTDASNHSDDSTEGADIEIASNIERLLTVTDAVFVTVSVSLFSHIEQLYSLLGNFGSKAAHDRLPRIHHMLLQLRSLAEGHLTTHQPHISSVELSWGGSAVPAQGGKRPKTSGGAGHRVDRLAEQLQRPIVARMDATLDAAKDIRAAVAHGDVAQILEDLRKRIRTVAADSSQRMLPHAPNPCVAPPSIKFLVKSSIDADALSAMYPGWTAWI